MDAVRFIREQRDETIEIVARVFKMDREVARKSYDFTASFFSQDLRINPEGVKRLIEIERESGGLQREVAVSEASDLSLVEEIYREAGR